MNAVLEEAKLLTSREPHRGPIRNEDGALWIGDDGCLYLVHAWAFWNILGWLRWFRACSNGVAGEFAGVTEFVLLEVVGVPPGCTPKYTYDAPGP